VQQSAFQMVEKFHNVFGQPVRKTVTPSPPEKKLRAKLLNEEHRELKKAVKHNDVVEIADALADMVYIICGTAHTYGIPLDEVIAEVHRSNMAKVGENGEVTRREDGKILKPSGWTPPNIQGILNVDVDPLTRAEVAKQKIADLRLLLRKL
jgi:predicted HAD superfamily Cof-like phosphohydrolase